jgi:hypothetical protein
VAPQEALAMLYQVMRSKLQRRICMVIKISGKPSFFFIVN